MAKNITKAKHRFPIRQLRQIGKFLGRNWPILALLFVSGLLIYLNYQPGTFLTGWDNLHPEFDIAENIRREIYSVWQQYRGPGLLAGQAQAADLPRTLLIALLLLIKVSPSLIRYVTTFLPFVLGPLGVYFLFYESLFKGKLDSKTIQFASFLGALYYILNLGTLQTFFVPFETFTWFYGALPWLLYFVIAYLTRPSLKNFAVLFLISFISAPSFYVETIFLVFFVALIPFLVEFILQQKHRLPHIKTAFISMLSIIVPHLFWLLPIVFFVFTNGHVTETAKIDLLSSPETYARNLQFATLKDTAQLKGYLFNYLDLGQDNNYTYLLSVWRNHLNISIINLVGFLSFALILTGLYYSFKKKFAWTKSFIALLFLCLFFLLGGGLLINQNIPLVGELFRSPFTKFSIPLSLAYSFFFAIGTIFLLDLFTFLHSRLTYYLTLFTVAFSLILFMSPAFSGNLIYPAMRQTIPSEYFNLFSFMKTQDPATRIANFPQFAFWGWESYDWGYRGSGFLWYGIRQPLMDRAFDVWDKNSEHYYEEMSTALYSDNQKDFESVFDKYSINWLLIDNHIILPGNATDSGLVTLKKYVANSGKFSLIKNFGDQIALYKVNLKDKVQNFINVSQPTSVSHPLDSLSLRPNTDWTQKGDFLSIAQSINAKEGDTLTIPSLSSIENLLPVRIEYRKSGDILNLRLTPIIPTIFINNNQLDLSTTSTTLSIPGTVGTGFILELNKDYFELQLPAEIQSFSDYYPLTTAYLPSRSNFTVSLYGSTETSIFDLTNSFSEATPQQCYVVKPNHKVEKITSQTGVSLIGTDVVGCLSAQLPTVPKGSLISLAFTYSSPTLTSANVNISGKDLNAQSLPQALEPQEKPTRTRIFVPSSGIFQQANLLLEAEETTTVKEINYENIEGSILPKIYTSLISLPNIPEKKIVLKNDISRLQISLPNTATQYDLNETPNSNSLLPENLNCDQFNLGNTVKQVTSNGFLYQSQNAIECDALTLRQLPHSISYLLSFDSQFQKGLTPTICLENHTSRRCDVDERLIQTDGIQSVIQPVSDSNEAPGYTLHIYNESFGNRITSNLIKSISVRPIPLRFLEGISLTNAQTATAAPVWQSSHPYPFFYTASVTNGQNSALNLYQTQSASWKAIQVSQNDLELPSLLLMKLVPLVFPFLPKLPHIASEPWHNSWTLPSNTAILILVYLPQYLEFVGFAAITISIIVAFVIIFIKKFPKKPR